MKIQLLFNLISKSIKGKIASHLQFIIIVGLVSLAISLTIIIINYLTNELTKISDEFDVVIVLNDEIDDKEINQYMDELLSKSLVNKVQYKDPITAMKEFIRNYDLNEQDLLIDDYFPNIITINLNLDYFSQMIFYNFISELRKSQYVSDVLYREAYINNIFLLVERLSWMFFILGIIIFLLITILLFISLRIVNEPFKTNLQITLSLGGSYLFNFISILLFIIFLVIIGLLLSLFVIILSWYILNYYYINLDIDLYLPALYSFISVTIYIVLITLFRFLFSFRGK